MGHQWNLIKWSQMIGLLYHPPCLHFYFNSEHINHSSIISTLKPNQVRINERLRPLPTACNNCMQLLPLPLMLYQATQTQDWPEHVFFFFFLTVNQDYWLTSFQERCRDIIPTTSSRVCRAVWPHWSMLQSHNLQGPPRSTCPKLGSQAMGPMNPALASQLPGSVWAAFLVSPGPSSRASISAPQVSVQ